MKLNNRNFINLLFLENLLKAFKFEKKKIYSGI